MTYQKPTPQEVLEAIERAFPVTPIPELIPKSDLSEERQAQHNELFATLSGVSWRDIDPRFIADRWFEIRAIYGSDIDNYYLPACLWQAMAEEGITPSYPGEDSRPCENHAFWQLYVNAEYIVKNDLEYTNKKFASFNEVQREAIKTYLRYKMGEPPDLDLGYFEALQWYWGRSDDPDADVRADSVEGLTSWQRPASPDEGKERLIQKIEQAWASVPYPGDDNLVDLRSWGEPFELYVYLKGKNWRTLHPRLLSRLSYISAYYLELQAYHYYIPAFLRAYLLGLLNDDRFINKILKLAGFMQEEDDKGKIRRTDWNLLSSFDEAQRQCLLAVIATIFERELEKTLQSLREKPSDGLGRLWILSSFVIQKSHYEEMNNAARTLQHAEKVLQHRPQEQQ